MKARFVSIAMFYKYALAFGLILGFTLGTSPLPPPPHQYNVRGKLVRPAGGSLTNFSVVLLGKSVFLMNDTTYSILTGDAIIPDYPDWPVALTDSLGQFTTRVTRSYFTDSLKVAVISYNNPLVAAPAFSVDQSRGIQISRTYDAQQGTGCSSCATDPGSTTRMVGYIHYVDVKNVTIPY